MATNPKIRYDIEANTEGEADVARLVAELGKLDDAIDPQAVAKAKELSAALQELGAKRAAVTTFLEVSAASNTAAKNLEEAQLALRKMEERLRSVEAPTRAQAGQLQKLRDQAERAQQAFTKNTEALSQARGALDRYGISANALGGAQERLTAAVQQTATAGRTLVTQYQQTATAAKSSAQVQAAAAQTVSESVDGIRQRLSQVQTLAGVALGGSFIGQMAGDVARTADEYANLAARIRLVTGEGAAFDSAFQGVIDIATRTGTALDTVGNLFARIGQSSKELKLGQAEQLALTETIVKATQLSGSSAQASSAAITQLTQSLASGVLRGEEFNSTSENSARIIRALADSLGVTVGRLREMAAQGQLTTDVWLPALMAQGSAIAQEFDKLPPTVGRALQNLSTQWTVYIGQQDSATGSSAMAAKALKLLGDNLNLVVSSLKIAGEAWLAMKAFDLAGTLARQALGMEGAAVATAANTTATTGNTIAKAANTEVGIAQAASTGLDTKAKLAHAEATTVDTVATAANTKAKIANAAAGTTGAAAGTAQLGTLTKLGRFAGVLGLVATGVALFGDAVADGFGKAGKWIGETAAKLAGYRDRSQEVLDMQHAQEEGAKAQAAQQARLNLELQRSQEATFGLTAEAKDLVGEFEGMQKKGESATASLEKLSKSMDLSNVQGIADAGAALDWLAQRGVITATQISAALGDALKGADLGRFETQARAAFDGSEQGARRLRMTLEAIGDEALKRVGTSVEELATGFDKASSSAISDVDALDRKLLELGKTGESTSGILSQSLDKAVQAAGTERAVQAVITRMEALGKQGRLTGDDLAAGLEKARKKLDELSPGIGSLSEALRTFGLKTREELQGTADKLGAAYRMLANDVSVSLADKAKAFNQWRDAAVAANGGVESSEVKLQRTMLETKIAASGLGDAITGAMGRARKATDEATSAQYRLAAGISATAGGIGGGGVRAPEGIPSIAEHNAATTSDENGRTPDQLARLREQGGPIDSSYSFQIRERVLRGDTFTAEEIPALMNGLRASQENARAAARGVGGLYDTATRRDDAMWVNTYRTALERAKGQALSGQSNAPSLGGANAGSGGGFAPAPAAVPVNVFIAGKSTPSTVNVATQADAEALVRLLEEAANT